MANSKPRLNSLSGFRGIMIFVIVMFHTINITPARQSSLLLTFLKQNGGYLGNYFFFMISGFLISYNYRDAIENKAADFFSFLKKRLITLYPLYFLTNCYLLLISILRNGLHAIDIRHIILVFLMQTGGAFDDAYPYNIATWFACTIMVCYVVYYVITYISKNKTQYYGLLIGGAVWGYILLNRNWNFHYCYNHTGEGFSNFFIGCFLAEVYFQLLSRRKVVNAINIGCILTLVTIAMLSMRYSFDSIVSDKRIMIIYLICPCTIYLVLSNKAFKTFFGWNPLVWLGKISTSIYFWHLPFYDMYSIVLRHTGLNAISYSIEYLVYIVLLIIFSAASYYFIERPVTKFFANRG